MRSVLLASLLAVTLAETERFELHSGPAPSTWLRQWPAPSLISCAARCVQLSGCQTLQWTDQCRLADGAAAETAASPVPLFRRIAVTSGTTVPPTPADGTTTDGAAPATAPTSSQPATTEGLITAPTVLPTAEQTTTETAASSEETTVDVTTPIATSTAQPTSTLSTSTATPEPTTTASPSTTAETTSTAPTSTTTPEPTTTTSPSTTAEPTSTAPTPTTTASPNGVTVGGRYYWHATSPNALNYDEARDYCGTLRPGGDLASLYTQAQLDFLWQDPARPAVQEWLGIKVGMYGWIYNPDGSELPFSISGTMEGSGSKITLPSGMTQQVLRKVSGPGLISSGTLLSGMVCDTPTP